MDSKVNEHVELTSQSCGTAQSLQLARFWLVEVEGAHGRVLKRFLVNREYIGRRQDLN